MNLWPAQRITKAASKGLLKAGMHGQFQNIEPIIALHTIFSSMRWLYDWFQPGKN